LQYKNKAIMGKTITKQEFLNRGNAVKVKEHYKTDKQKNGWFYIVVMQSEAVQIEFHNSMN